MARRITHLMLLFLCGVVESQAVDFSGPETAEPSNGCFGIGEQVQLHGQVRADDDDAAAEALIDPAPRDAELLDESGHGQPAQEIAQTLGQGLKYHDCLEPALHPGLPGPSRPQAHRPLHSNSRPPFRGTMAMISDGQNAQLRGYWANTQREAEQALVCRSARRNEGCVQGESIS